MFIFVNESVLLKLTFKRQPHKMVKHTQTICRLLPTNCLSVFDHFVGLTLKELTEIVKSKYRSMQSVDTPKIKKFQGKIITLLSPPHLSGPNMILYSVLSPKFSRLREGVSAKSLMYAPPHSCLF